MSATAGLHAAALGLGAGVVLALAVWAVSVPKRDVSIVDSAWSFLVLVPALVVAAVLPEVGPRADPRNRGQMMDRGLWRFSRHPNYFGECCLWWGVWLAAAAAGAWWSVVSPLLMTVLLLKVSGVPLLERSLGRHRPGYAEYVQRTPALLPWRVRG